MKARIVDVVYAVPRERPQSRHLVAVLCAVVMHLGVVAFAAQSDPGLGPWSAALALSVHDELARETVVTLEPPPTPPAREQPPVVLNRVAPVAPARPSAAPAPAPAAAAPLVTASDAPVDFPTFVTGNEKSFAGGTTTPEATAAHAVSGPVAHENASLPVRLADEEWSCPWPTRAASDLIDQQQVVIKVLVREDGSVVEARLVKDAPGGFGDAALQCAKKTHFLPARDPAGAVVRRWSPPIEVRFSR